ncbi:MAG: isoprenyl transferase [Candidatus Omnitrophica bacterium]|nr:isoprenyl transferase [Candidatus Omnitrophota bacterium]
MIAPIPADTKHPVKKNPAENLSTNLPQHVAIIMDGNGRWAKSQHLPRIEGHRAGVESIRDTLRACNELGIPYLTLYAFSNENWQRPKDEVSFLMRLLSEYLDQELKELNKNNIRFQVIGRKDMLPAEIQKKIERNVKETVGNKKLVLTLALSYSGRLELVDAVRKIAQKIKDGSLELKDITESTIEENLYTVGLPDPDFLIRTSGEMRISNFLLWQMSYTEIYVTDVLWPDFRKQHFIDAIEAYQKRERRFGRTNLPQ